jgi:hypothetical protein
MHHKKDNKRNYNKRTGAQLPERFEISTNLLNQALGFLSLMPVYQSMELITRINMDITPVKTFVKGKQEDSGPDLEDELETSNDESPETEVTQAEE